MASIAALARVPQRVPDKLRGCPSLVAAPRAVKRRDVIVRVHVRGKGCLAPEPGAAVQLRARPGRLRRVGVRATVYNRVRLFRQIDAADCALHSKSIIFRLYNSFLCIQLPFFSKGAGLL